MRQQLEDLKFKSMSATACLIDISKRILETEQIGSFYSDATYLVDKVTILGKVEEVDVS